MTNTIEKDYQLQNGSLARKVIHTDIAVAREIESNLLMVEYLPNASETENSAREMFELCSEGFNGKPWSVLIDIRNLISITKEARAFYAKQPARYNCRRAALLVNSYLSMLTANIFMWFDQPAIPTRMFTSEANALQWIHQSI